MAHGFMRRSTLKGVVSAAVLPAKAPVAAAAAAASEKEEEEEDEEDDAMHL